MLKWRSPHTINACNQIVYVIFKLGKFGARHPVIRQIQLVQSCNKMFHAYIVCYLVDLTSICIDSSSADVVVKLFKTYNHIHICVNIFIVL